MAKVSLRAYNREIEAMIDRGHLDEAIAHCQHILKTFPKHLETYRLLGKSYLEAKRHKEAVDIFSRVLVAEPGDFVAQVGMSIIRDEQDKFDDAIWHMERAFETQPSNAAIQGELQRLYGRRDGVQPPRIRMTRGALAHMYMQGGLYPQAISETRGVLEEDQGRTDMQALLAKAYFKSGQKNDAADAASTALKRYPYCLDANRVLTEILGSDRPESAEVYRRRVFELDPYAAHANNSVFESQEVSDAAITLEQLDWNGQPVGMSSDWGSTGAISLKEGEQPDWLKSAAPPEESSPPPSAPAFVSEQEKSSEPESDSPAEPAEDIPDFLRQAGWGESTGDFDESKSSTMFDDEPASEAQPIEQGNMPDWVKAMAPEDTPASEAAEDEEMPDWINKIGTGELPVPAVDASTDDQPDWLSQTNEDASDGSDKPDLSSQFGLESEAAPSMQADDDMDLLDTLKSDEPEAPVTSSEERTAMPDETGNLGMGEQEQDDSFAWLENLAAKQGASEGLLTTPEERREDEPDWIKQAKGLGESPDESSTEEQQQPEEKLPAESVVPTPASANVEELGKSDEERDDSFSWLENLAAKQGATEGLLTNPEERREDEPDWVKQAKDSSGSEPPAQVPAESAETSSATEEDMDWMKNAKEVGEKFFDDSMGTSELEVEPTVEAADPPVKEKVEEAAPVSTTDSDSDSDAWLKTLEEPEPEQTPAATSSSEDDMMAWMKQDDAPPVAEAAVPEDETTDVSDDLPGWLSGLDEEESKPAAAPTSDDDMPAWMTDETGELVAEPTRIEPTRSTDWTPEEQKETEAMEEASPPPPAPEPVADTPQSAPEPEPEPVAKEAEKPAPEPEKKPKRQEKEIKPAPPPEPYKEPVTRKTTGMLEMPVDPILGSARAELTRSNIPGALETYGKLIKKGRFLEEVIYDLRDALYRYPVEVSIWQSLGDAYMRANQLQDALDAYTKAEELLR